MKEILVVIAAVIAMPITTASERASNSGAAAAGIFTAQVSADDRHSVDAPVRKDEAKTPTYLEYIEQCTVPKETIRLFLNGPAWARFDSELGYVQQNYLRHDAIDGSSSINTFGATGARTSFMYANRAPRINTYGDSFTFGEQVSDGETWQEYLAAHLGEPIGNFGIGSYGVYQAYRRMIREERTSHGAHYVILYIWGDDPTRSLMRSRYCAVYPWFLRNSPAERVRRFHGNFWAHVEMDLNTAQFVERENPLSTRQSLYRMADPKWMIENLKDDLALQLLAYSTGAISDLDRTQIEKLAATLSFSFDWGSVPIPSAESRVQAAALLNLYSQRATIFTLEKAKAFTRGSGKKLLVILFDPFRVTKELVDGRPRSDEITLNYLMREKIDFFDMNEVQLRDFRKFSLSWDDYMKQYYIGHYNPQGNHLFAYALKRKIVEWLDPKPITYLDRDTESFDFTGYLPGYRKPPQ